MSFKYKLNDLVSYMGKSERIIALPITAYHYHYDGHYIITYDMGWKIISGRFKGRIHNPSFVGHTGLFVNENEITLYIKPKCKYCV